MQDAQKREASRNRVSFEKGPCHTTGCASVLEGASMVADLVWEAEPLLVWETNLLPGDGGWNTCLTKRECRCFCSIERYSHIGLGVGHVRIIVGTHIAFFIL